MSKIPYTGASSGAAARDEIARLLQRMDCTRVGFMVKGQIAAIESGLFEFDEAFLPHMLTENGRTVMQQVAESKLLSPAREGA